MLKGHGGDIVHAAAALGCEPADIIDLSANVSPLPFPSALRSILKQRIDEIANLPDITSEQLKILFAEKYNLSQNQLIFGNGTTELIFSIPKIHGLKSAMIAGPTYTDYADACQLSGLDVEFVLSKPGDNFEHAYEKLDEASTDKDIVFICNPNNPTGQMIPRDKIQELAFSHPSTTFVIDETYMPFVENYSESSFLFTDIPYNIILVHSFSMIYGIPGLRLGVIVASEENMLRLRKVKQPWSVNIMAQIAGEYLINADDHVEKVRKHVQQERQRFIKELRYVDNIKIYPSTTNFFLLAIEDDHLTAGILCQEMLNAKIMLRNCSNFHGLSDQYIRLSIKQAETNAKCIDVLKYVLYNRC